MGYEHRQHDNSGALFKNDKQGNQNWPDYKGSIMVDGVEYWISAWLKESKQGKKFMSLSVQPKQKNRQPGQDDDLESIPF